MNDPTKTAEIISSGDITTEEFEMDGDAVEKEFARLVLLLGRMDLLDFPVEVLYMVVEQLEYTDLLPTLCALAATSGGLRRIIEPLLYKEDARRYIEGADWWDDISPRAWSHGAFCNMVPVMEKSLKALHTLGHELDIDRVSDQVPAKSYLVQYSPSWGFIRGSAMHLASFRGNNDVIKYLLQLGARLTLPTSGICACSMDPPWIRDNNDASDENGGSQPFHGWLPLHFALCHGHSTTAKLLIEAGAPAMMTEPQANITAAHSAAEADHDAWLYALIQKKVDDKAQGWADVGERLCKTSIIDWIGPRGTPLHHAIAASKRSPLKSAVDAKHTIGTLLRLGAKVDSTTPQVPTPLTLAVELGCWDIAAMLLDFGASVTPPHQPPVIFPAIWSEKHHSGGEENVCLGIRVPRANRPAEGLAELESHEEVIKRIMVEGKPNLNEYCSKHGETPLTYLAWSARVCNCHTDTIPFLVELGADVNQQDTHGNTVLHVLASSVNRCTDLAHPLVISIEYILKHGGIASLNIKNKEGEVPADLLIKRLPARGSDSGDDMEGLHCAMLANIFLLHAHKKDSPSCRTAKQVVNEWLESVFWRGLGIR